MTLDKIKEFLPNTNKISILSYFLSMAPNPEALFLAEQIYHTKTWDFNKRVFECSYRGEDGKDFIISQFYRAQYLIKTEAEKIDVFYTYTTQNPDSYDLGKRINMTEGVNYIVLDYMSEYKLVIFTLPMESGLPYRKEMESYNYRVVIKPILNEDQIEAGKKPIDFMMGMCF